MDKSVPAGAAILLDFIGSIEAPKGYDTIYGNNQAKLAKPLTSMTVAEVIAAGPSWTKRFGSSACGRYQFMKDTLKGLITEGAVSSAQTFSAETQDLLGYHLLKRRGYDQFMATRLGIAAFGLKLAQEWASFPVLKATKGAHRQVARGETYYAGDRLNKSLVPPERIEAVLAEALAAGSQPREVSPRRPATDRMAIPAGKWAEDALPSFEVKAIQTRLVELGYHTVGLPDGIWGDRTTAAVKALQEQASRKNPAIVPDGHYGPQTKALLGDEGNHAIVSQTRKAITATDLAAIGTPAVVQGRRIQWSSLLSLVTTLGGVLMLAFQNYQAGTDTLPFWAQAALNFMPPWVAMLAPAALALYNAAAAKGLIGSAVERVREGIDNSGLPPASDTPGGLFGSLFGAR